MTKRRPVPASHPKFHHGYGTKFPSAPDGWELRLRQALRFGNGAVLTARQVREIAVVVGWEVVPDLKAQRRES